HALPERRFPRLKTIFFLGAPRVRRLVRALGADLVYGHDTLAPVIGALPAAIARVPFVWSPRTPLPERGVKRLAVLAAARFGVAGLLPPSAAVERSCGAVRA